MKIVQLETENVKRLKAISITPKGDVVVIGGNNANGKTSVLDAIEMALGGKNSIPDEPIRRGQESARVVLDLGDMVIKRTFTPNGSQVVVSSREGLRYPSPQAVLDAMVGRLSFDPLAFLRMKAADQVATLKQLGGLDFSDLDKKRALAYQNRTDATRRTKELVGAIANMPELSGVPDEEIKVADLMAEQNKIRAHNGRFAAHQRQIQLNARTALELEEQVDLARAKLRDLESRHEAAKQEALNYSKRAADAGELAQLPEDDIVAQIVAAGDINKKVQQRRERSRLMRELDTSQDKENELTETLWAVDRAKEELLAAAKFAVPGLSFSDTGVTLNGLPFGQASGAEQLKTSVAIGLAQNPKLKVLLIRDGSLLDDASMEAIGEQAATAGAQLWIERVGTDGHTSVVIEDGEIKAAMPEPATVQDSAPLS